MLPALVFFAIVLPGAALAQRWWRRAGDVRRARARLKGLPEASTTVAAGTEVRLTGVVRALGAPLIAPLSGTPCVLYRARLTPGPIAAFARGRWRGYAEGGDTFELRPFLVDRGALGAVLVDAEIAELDLPTTPRGAVDRERQFSFVASQGLSRQANGVAEEVILAAGTTVTVVGFAMLDIPASASDAETGFRDGPAPTLRITGSRAHPLVIARAD